MNKPLQTTLLLLALAFFPEASFAGPILHEYVPPPGANRNAHLYPKGQLPDRIKMDSRTSVERPRRAARPAPGEKVHDSVRRKPSVRLDRKTTHDGVLRYSAVFNPSVVPFKRNGAFDTVKAGYSLTVGNPTLHEVKISRTPHSPDRDLFWGSLALDLTRGQPVSIPSVAANARILNYTVKPASVKVRFFKDSAANFWVRSDRSAKVRLVFLTDAATSYFTPRIPGKVTAANVPPHLRPRLPGSVNKAAARVIKHLKISRSEPMYWQLSKLTSYFRSFKAGVLQRVTGDTYLDIVFSKRGVCRHRAFAFVVTAHALGIPARYVHNEAHAFAEAYVPRMGWTRVDLGGASSELQVKNADNRLIHSPRPDPFPHPSRFSSSYSQLQGRVTGLDDKQRKSFRRTGDRRGHGQAGSGVISGSSTGRGPARSGMGPGPVARRTTINAAGPAGPAAPPRSPVMITLNSPTRSVLRGGALQVAGKILHRGVGVKGLTVKIFLGQGGAPKHVIGTLVTDADGAFNARIAVPADVQVGEYRIYASTPGNRSYRDAISR